MPTRRVGIISRDLLSWFFIATYNGTLWVPYGLGALPSPLMEQGAQRASFAPYGDPKGPHWKKKLGQDGCAGGGYRLKLVNQNLGQNSHDCLQYVRLDSGFNRAITKKEKTSIKCDVILKVTLPHKIYLDVWCRSPFLVACNLVKNTSAWWRNAM